MKRATALYIAIAAMALPATAAFALPSRASFAYSFGAASQVSLLIDGTTTINATRRGWVTSTGNSNFGGVDGNYIVGLCGSGEPCLGDDLVRNNWFVFDLSNFRSVTSAVLQLSQTDDAFGVVGHDGYLSANPFETYTLWNTDESGASLSGAFGSALFLDLASGISFGNQSVDASSIGGVVSVGFNAAGVAALNANVGGLYGFGGTLGVPVPGVPEPQSWALLIAGFGLTGAAMRRRRVLATA